jgi:hypothetical protein
VLHLRNNVFQNRIGNVANEQITPAMSDGEELVDRIRGFSYHSPSLRAFSYRVKAIRAFSYRAGPIRAFSYPSKTIRVFSYRVRWFVRSPSDYWAEFQQKSGLRLGGPKSGFVAVAQFALQPCGWPIEGIFGGFGDLPASLVSDKGPLLDVIALGSERARRLAELVNELPSDERRVFDAFVKDRPLSEMARDFRRSVSWVKATLAAACSLLRARVPPAILRT